MQRLRASKTIKVGETGTLLKGRAFFKTAKEYHRGGERTPATGCGDHGVVRGKVIWKIAGGSFLVGEKS